MTDVSSRSVSENSNTPLSQAPPSPYAFLNAEHEKAVFTWLDDVIQRLYDLYGAPPDRATIVTTMSYEEVIRLLEYSSCALMRDGSLAEIEVPVKIVGDIHGQFQDLNRLFEIIGKPPSQKLVFLGDYVDRGPHQLEVICLMLALKVRYPQQVILLRGNHETPAVNRVYGFYEECARKYGTALWYEFQTVFARMPMAGLVSKLILCMHGGLSPELTSLDRIRMIPRPCEPVDRGMLIDLLWSDPTNKGDGWFYSPRGISYAFGKGVVAAACNMLNIDLVVRAHQVVQDGYELMIGRHLVTIFSAPNYCNEFANAAAVACISEDLEVSFQQLRVASAVKKTAPPVARDMAEPEPCPDSPMPTFRLVIPKAEDQAATTLVTDAKTTASEDVKTTTANAASKKGESKSDSTTKTAVIGGKPTSD